MAKRTAIKLSVAQQPRGNGPIEEREVDVAELRDIDLLRSLVPVRQVKAFRNKVGRVRYQPLLNSDHPPVACESRAEAVRVMELDRQGDVEWIVGQPFWLRVFVGGRLAIKHAPDLLYGFKDGGVMLENVRLPVRRTAMFQAKAEACERFVRLQGWQYQTVGGHDGYEAELLTYLWNYASVVPSSQVVQRIVHAFREQDKWRLGELRERCAPGLVDYPAIMALLWRGELAVDVTEPLSTWTWVRLGEMWRRG